MSTKDSMFSDLPEILTISEAADILRVTPLTLKRWEKKGKIHPMRINSRGDRRYTKKQILGLLGIETEPEQTQEPVKFGKEESSEPIPVFRSVKKELL